MSVIILSGIVFRQQFLDFQMGLIEAMEQKTSVGSGHAYFQSPA
jgi:hypothetical protein